MMIELSGPTRSPKAGGRAEYLVILLHGVGADGNDLIDLADKWSTLLPKAAFVSPNAPFSCEGAPFGFQWFSLRDMTKEAMLKGIKEVAPVLNNYINKQLIRYGLNDDRLVLAGFSQGTMMALHMGLTREQKMAGVLGYSGALLNEDKMNGQNITKTPVMLVHGDIDMVVPSQAMFIAEQELDKMGVPVQAILRPGLGHGIDDYGIKKGGEFIAERLGATGRNRQSA
jgi:phospholipase/carboxylesterase